MTATNIIASSGIAVLLAVGACDSSKTPAEANKEANKALEKHAEEVKEAKQEPTQEERNEKLVEANEELAEDIGDAYENVDPAVRQRYTELAKTDPDAAAVSPDKRFPLVDNETHQDFTTRANKTLSALDADLARVKPQAPADEVKGVEEKLTEARKDLTELTAGTDKVIDDGKLGVTVAINSARRKLDRIQEDLADDK